MVLTDRRNLPGTWLKSECCKSSSGRFSFSAGKNAIIKSTEYVTFEFFFPHFGFLSLLAKFERHSL